MRNEILNLTDSLGIKFNFHTNQFIVSYEQLVKLIETVKKENNNVSGMEEISSRNTSTP